MLKHQQPKDILYIYRQTEYQFKYYANKISLNYQEGDYILGIDSLDKKDGQDTWRMAAI